MKLKRWLSIIIIFILVMVNPYFAFSQSDQIGKTADNPFPRKVLLELFTATWCGPCATYGYLADELADEFGPDKVILCRNQVFKDGLNTPETDARASFYTITGVPALVTSGKGRSHPGEVDKNRGFVNAMLAKKSPFRMMMQYSNKNLQLNIQNGTSLEFDNLHLITLLYETNVHYEGQNGETEHKHVVRDYIEDETGLLLSISSNETIDITIPVNYRMNITKEYYLVSFLQDEVTKEIYQAESIITKASNTQLPDLQISGCTFMNEVEEESICRITPIIVNKGVTGSKACHIRLYLSPYEDWDTTDDLMIPLLEIPGLQPNETAEVTFSFLFPDLGKKEYLIWMLFHIDPGNEVSESNENNLFKWDNPIKVKDAVPKLKPPEPFSPREGEEINLPFTFQWLEVNGASKYILIIQNIPYEEAKSFTRMASKAEYTFESDDTQLLPGSYYRYAVIALSSEGIRSPESGWTNFYVKMIQKKYFNLSAKCVTKGISLNWEKLPEATGGYNVYKKLASEESYPSRSINQFLVRENEYMVTEALNEGESYCFIIKPADSAFQEILNTESIEACIEFFPVKPKPERITITPATATVFPDQSIQFTASVSDHDNQVLLNTPVSWSVRGDIGLINPDGLFTALNRGTGQVVARVDNIEAIAEVIVISHPITITLQIGNKTVIINKNGITNQMILDSPPFIQDSYTMVPLRFIGETFGATIAWHPEYQIIILEFDKKGLQIVLTINHLTAYINGKITILDVPPVIQKGRTFVPLRFIGEATGCSIEWEANEQKVKLIYHE